MGMSRKERFVRSVGLTSAFFMLISCFLLIGLLVMDIIGFNIVEIDKPREYWIQFQSEERMLVDTKVVRGNKIDKPGDPSHSPDEYFAYTFRVANDIDYVRNYYRNSIRCVMDSVNSNL